MIGVFCAGFRASRCEVNHDAGDPRGIVAGNESSNKWFMFFDACCIGLSLLHPSEACVSTIPAQLRVTQAS